jgi:DNA helicase HerA-like ATPase
VPPPTGPLVLGVKRGVGGEPVTLEPNRLVHHMAFLGGTGSGKTTAALNLIEILLLRGVPAVLVDRKGDLCRYADPDSLSRPTSPAEQEPRRRLLRERLDVSLYTPGQPGGRPLAIPLVPDGQEPLNSADRELLAGYAAAALGGMMNYRSSGADKQKLAVLRKALELLGDLAGKEASLPNLIRYLDEGDDTLFAAVGNLADARLFARLARDLQTLHINQSRLLAGDAERLNLDALLGLNEYAKPGKTRLSIISMRFLEANAVEFWVSQFLTALNRWCARRPRGELQAVFLFDEADRYLPAVGKPATKEPMESLLKRSRSAGVGVFLATQSPGDFDYKWRDNIQTWLVGRVKEETALKKLKPMFSECRVDVAAKLPGQETGQFYLLREKEATALQAAPSVMKTEQVSEERILELARANAGGRVAV